MNQLLKNWFYLFITLVIILLFQHKFSTSVYIVENSFDVDKITV